MKYNIYYLIIYVWNIKKHTVTQYFHTLSYMKFTENISIN